MQFVLIFVLFFTQVLGKGVAQFAAEDAKKILIPLPPSEKLLNVTEHFIPTNFSEPQDPDVYTLAPDQMFVPEKFMGNLEKINRANIMFEGLRHACRKCHSLYFVSNRIFCKT